MKEKDKQPAYLYGVSPASSTEEIRTLWPAVPVSDASAGSEYEIRLSGDTASPIWEDWFDSPAVKRQPGGITLLKIYAADQAALYGMLSRLRELDLTLESIRRLDPQKSRTKWWRRLGGELRHVNWIIVGFYLVALGAIVPMAIYLANLLGAALGLGLMFGALGGLALAAYQMDKGWGWAVVAGVNAVGLISTLPIYLANDAGLPPEIAIGVLFLVLTGVGAGAYSVWRTRRSGGEPSSPLIPEGGAVVRITVRGRLTSEMWADRFAGLTIEARDDGTTTLMGSVESQGRLYALLASLRDLALPLVSVVPVRGLNNVSGDRQ